MAGSLRRHREAVVVFHNAYGEYLEAGQGGSPELRMRVVELIPSAQSGLNAAGVDLTVYPPPAFGGYVRHGLANLVFEHEDGIGFNEPIPGQIMDALRLAGANLDQRMADRRRHMRNPLWWLDGVVKVVLGIPAYILSRFLRVPFDRIDGAPVLGTLLRLVSLATALVGLYAAGQRVGWW